MNRYFYHKDHLGSIVGLSDISGNNLIEYDYDVFGKTYVKVGTGEYVGLENYTGNVYNNSRLYTAREYDGEIGLYFYRARYYDGNIGRFISRDSIGQVDNVNLYTYVGNNLINYVDPAGLNAATILMEYGTEVAGIGGRAALRSVGGTVGVGWDLWNGGEVGSADEFYENWRNLGSDSKVEEQQQTQRDILKKGSGKTLTSYNDSNGKVYKAEGNEGKSEENKSFNQGNNDIRTGKSPKGFREDKAFDKGTGKAQDHVHDSNGNAMNIDGTMHHGSKEDFLKTIGNKGIEYLRQFGFNI